MAGLRAAVQSRWAAACGAPGGSQHLRYSPCCLSVQLHPPTFLKRFFSSRDTQELGCHPSRAAGHPSTRRNAHRAPCTHGSWGQPRTTRSPLLFQQDSHHCECTSAPYTHLERRLWRIYRKKNKQHFPWDLPETFPQSVWTSPFTSLK